MAAPSAPQGGLSVFRGHIYRLRLILTALSSLLATGAAPAPDDPTTPNPPNIIGLERISVAENSAAPIATYTTRHVQGDSIIWSLAGRDAAAFTFTTDKERQTMTLFFRAIPDYEQPADGQKIVQHE